MAKQRATGAATQASTGDGLGGGAGATQGGYAVAERGRTAVVEVGRMLPSARRGVVRYALFAVRATNAPSTPVVRRRVQRPCIVVSAGSANVSLADEGTTARCATTGESQATWRHWPTLRCWAYGRLAITSPCSQPLPRSCALRRRRGLLPSRVEAP